MTERDLIFAVNLNPVLHERVVRIAHNMGCRIKSFVDPNALSKEASPRCILFDFLGLGIQGLDWQDWLPTRHVPFLVISPHVDVPMAVHLMKKGAFAVFDSTFRDSEFVDGIDAALVENRKRLDHETRLLEIDEIEAELNPRDVVVLESTTQGLSARTISSLSGISYRTVESIRTKLMKTFRVKSTQQLAAAYAESQILKHGRIRVYCPHDASAPSIPQYAEKSGCATLDD